MTSDEAMLRQELLSGPTDELWTFFRESYGKNYRENSVQRAIERATKIIGLRHAMGSLVAAATLENSRISLAGSSTNRELGKRAVFGRYILDACYRDGSAAWLTIGEHHRAVRVIASMAGMERVDGQETLAPLLEEALEFGHNYAVEDNESGGLVIISGPNATKPGYRQQVWAWADRLVGELDDRQGAGLV